MPGVEEAKVTAGMVVNTNNEQEVGLLVPSTQSVTKGSEYGPEAKYIAGNDVITALLFALPPQTWIRTKIQIFQNKMKNLVSIGTLFTMISLNKINLSKTNNICNLI
jgi:glutathione gamma-glutamylcysteinyltransferase